MIEKESEKNKSEFGGNSPEDIERIETWIQEDVESAMVKMVKIEFVDGDSLYGKFISYEPETNILTIEEYVPDGAGYKDSGEKREIRFSEKKVKQLSLRGGTSIRL